MRGFVRPSLLAALLLAASAPALADGLYLPPPPTGPGGEDRIETASGTRCSQSINSNGSYLDVGVAGSSANGRDTYSAPFFSDRRGSEALGYVRMTIPLGHRPERVDCTRLYELEIQRMKREIELLKLAAE
jgi:hypothetical protein